MLAALAKVSVIFLLFCLFYIPSTAIRLLFAKRKGNAIHCVVVGFPTENKVKLELRPEWQVEVKKWNKEMTTGQNFEALVWGPVGGKGYLIPEKAKHDLKEVGITALGCIGLDIIVFGGIYFLS